MNVAVDFILRFLLRQNVIENGEDSIAYCRYGIEITISSLFNVLLIIIIGLLFGLVIDSIVFLVIFINMRRYTGGYHASTYLRCNTTLCISFTALCFIMKAIIISDYYLVLFLTVLIHILSFCIIVIFSPLENENKPLTDNLKRINHIKSIVFSVTAAIVNLILLSFHIIRSVMIALTVLLVAILMIIKIVKEGKA